MSSPFVLDLLRETLEFLEAEFPVLSVPPETTREAQVAVLCCRLRYALQTEGDSAPYEDPFGSDEAPDLGEDWDLDPDPYETEGEEYQPYGWTPALWSELDRPDTPDVDASGRCFSDADPGL